MGANEKVDATLHPHTSPVGPMPPSHTPTVQPDEAGHPWHVCTTCGARSSATLASVCPGPNPAREVRVR